MMTEPGDFEIYPRLGVSLNSLYGMPQDPQTGEYGKRLIREALDREGVFRGKNIQINAIPTAPDCIRFDIQIVTPYGEPIVLSVSQNL